MVALGSVNGLGTRSAGRRVELSLPRAGRRIADLVRRAGARGIAEQARLAADVMDRIRAQWDLVGAAEKMGQIYGLAARGLHPSQPEKMSDFLCFVVKERIKQGEHREQYLEGVIWAMLPLGPKVAGRIAARIALGLYPKQPFTMAGPLAIKVPQGVISDSMRRENNYRYPNDFLLGVASEIYRGDPILAQPQLVVKRLREAGFWDPELVRKAQEGSEKKLNIVSRDQGVTLVETLRPSMLHDKAGQRLIDNLRLLAESRIAIGGQLWSWVRTATRIRSFFRQQDLRATRIGQDPGAAAKILNDLLKSARYVREDVLGSFYDAKDPDSRYWFEFMIINEAQKGILGGDNYLLDLFTDFDPC